MNKYKVNLPNPVLATNDAVLATGITGTRWVGTNPTVAGVAANFVAGNGLIFSDSIDNNKTDTALSKVITLTIPALTAGQDNVIQETLSALEFSGGITILGIIGLGVVDMAAGATLVSNPIVLAALNYSIVRNSLIIKVPAAEIANVENKSLNIIIYYR